MRSSDGGVTGESEMEEEEQERRTAVSGDGGAGRAETRRGE